MKHQNRIETGEELKLIRKTMKINRTQLSRETGLSTSILQKIEDGRKKGSLQTWNIINNYFSEIDAQTDNLMSQLKKDIKEYNRNQLVKLEISTQNKCFGIFQINGYEIVKEKNERGLYTTLGYLKQIL